MILAEITIPQMTGNVTYTVEVIRCCAGIPGFYYVKAIGCEPFCRFSPGGIYQTNKDNIPAFMLQNIRIESEDNVCNLKQKYNEACEQRQVAFDELKDAENSMNEKRITVAKDIYREALRQVEIIEYQIQKQEERN